MSRFMSLFLIRNDTRSSAQNVPTEVRLEGRSRPSFYVVIRSWVTNQQKSHRSGLNRRPLINQKVWFRRVFPFLPLRAAWKSDCDPPTTPGNVTRKACLNRALRVQGFDRGVCLSVTPDLTVLRLRPDLFVVCRELINASFRGVPAWR